MPNRSYNLTSKHLNREMKARQSTSTSDSRKNWIKNIHEPIFVVPNWGCPIDEIPFVVQLGAHTTECGVPTPNHSRQFQSIPTRTEQHHEKLWPIFHPVPAYSGHSSNVPTYPRQN